METFICPCCGANLTHSGKCDYCGSSSGPTPSPVGENIEHERIPQKGKLYIHGYQGFYIANPSIKVYMNGTFINKLEKGGFMELDILEDCLIKFKCHFRTNEYEAKKNKIESLQLAFNDFTGSLEIYVTHSAERWEI